jgi:hypothetical protein
MPTHVMLSANEASAFRTEKKQILRLRLRMTFGGLVQFIQLFSKERTKATKNAETYILTRVLLASFVVKQTLRLE